jgi:hypothetical protein
MMEEIACEFADDDVRASGLSVGSSSANSSPVRTRCHCGIESPVRTSRTQKNRGRRFIGCGKFKVRI